MSIHQEVLILATTDRIYEALIDEDQFSKITGNLPTEIDGREGGRFSCFGGMITGRNVELVPGRRIVQAWRVKSWEPGTFSIVSFELIPEGSATKIIFDHTGYPEAEEQHLAIGWSTNYWRPLQEFLE